MRMRLIMVVAFLTAMTAGVADAEWDYRNAKPQPFQIFDGYVIAVGTEDKLEPVQASDVLAALQAGKEIRLRYAEVQGDLMFSDLVQQDVSFLAVTFTEDVSFRSAITLYLFAANIHFDAAIFAKKADFSATIFRGDISFDSTTFTGKAKFYEATFTRRANFHKATFAEDADFRYTTFTGGADFGYATFTGGADFRIATFAGVAYFTDATFTKKADFSIVTFKSYAVFRSTSFTGVAYFNLASFIGVADLRNATFTEKADFHDARFTGKVYLSKANFIGDMDFRNTLENIYDELFYLTLITKYKEQGWLNYADSAYYDYRQKKRRRRNILYGGLEFIFLESPFGYGVKPWRLLLNFVLLWIPFGIYYTLCLHYKLHDRLNYRRRYKQRPVMRFLFKVYDKLRRFLWGVLYSFDTITLGIDLHSMKYLEQSPYLFNDRSKVIMWVQGIQKLLGWYLLALFLVMFGKIWVR